MSGIILYYGMCVWGAARKPRKRQAHACMSAQAYLAIMLRCGKFKGHTHEHVKKLDKGYCAWVLRAQREKQPLPRDLRKFADHLKTQHGGILTVGIHKGTFFDEVLAKHPDYGDWAG